MYIQQKKNIYNFSCITEKIKLLQWLIYSLVQLRGIVSYNLIGHAGCYDCMVSFGDIICTCTTYNVIIAVSISLYILPNRCTKQINVLIKSL